MKKLSMAICLIATLTFTARAQVIDQFPYNTGNLTSEEQLEGWTKNFSYNFHNTYGLYFYAGVDLISPELKGGLMTVSVTISEASAGTYLQMHCSYDGITFDQIGLIFQNSSGSVSNQTASYKLPFGVKYFKIKSNSSSTTYIKSISINNEISQTSTYKNLTWTLSGTTSNVELNVSGTGVIPDFKAPTTAALQDSIPWYKQRNGIAKLTIGSGITEVGNNAFRNMSYLKDIVIPSSITRIGNFAFYNCAGPTSLYIPNTTTSIGESAFEGMTNLDYVSFGTGLKSMGKSAFAYCTKLTSVRFNATDCRSFEFDEKIPQSSVFYGNTVLRTYLFGSNVKTIPDYMFAGLTMGFRLFWQDGQNIAGYEDLGNIAIPPTIKRIGKGAFYDTRFILIDIPANVDTIGAEAFRNITTLKELSCERATPPVLGGGLVFHNIDKGDCLLIVPSSSYNAYAGAAQWKDFMFIVDASYTNAALRSLAVNGSAVADFDDGVYTYSMNVPFEVASITLNAEAAGAGSTIEGVGTFDLNVGLNVFIITVTAADGVSTMTYSIGVTRAPDPLFVNAFLQSLLVDGTSVVNFNSEVYTYSMNVPYSTSAITLSAEAVADGATVEGVGTFDLEVGLNTFLITVTAADGVSTTTYTVKVTRSPESVGVEILEDVMKLSFNNPVSDGQLRLFGFDPASAVEIYDLNGRKMYESRSGSDVISVAGFARGVYVVKNGKQVAKVVKQ